MRWVAVCSALLFVGCESVPVGPPRAVWHDGDPALDGNTLLLSEPDFRAVIALVTAEIARSHPWVRLHRVHVISDVELEVYATDLSESTAYSLSKGDDYLLKVRRTSKGWKIDGWQPIVIIVTKDLTM